MIAWLTFRAVGRGRCITVLALAMMLAGCAVITAAKTTPDISLIKTVAMMPVQNMAEIYGVSRNVRNPLSGSIFLTGAVSRDAASAFESAVYSRAAALGRFRVLPPERALGALSSLTARDADPITDRALWLNIGRTLKAEGALVCFLYRYSDRIGSRYAVEQPASVAFDLYLLRISDGRIIWNGRFDETQRALSENLLEIDKFVKRKGWISAADMTTTGLDDLFAGLRKAPAVAGGAGIDP